MSCSDKGPLWIPSSSGFELTGFSTWLRESTSLLAFPTVLIFHTLGLAFLVGTNAAIDLRILGFAPSVPLTALETFFPLMTYGFWVNAVSGVVLLWAYPAKALTNPLFFFKLALVATGLLILTRIKRDVFGRPESDHGALPRRIKILAGASLACWLLTIAAGRLLAYTNTQLLLSI